MKNSPETTRTPQTPFLIGAAGLFFSCALILCKSNGSLGAAPQQKPQLTTGLMIELHDTHFTPAPTRAALEKIHISNPAHANKKLIVLNK